MVLSVQLHGGVVMNKTKVCIWFIVLIIGILLLSSDVFFSGFIIGVSIVNLVLACEEIKNE